MTSAPPPKPPPTPPNAPAPDREPGRDPDSGSETARGSDPLFLPDTRAAELRRYRWVATLLLVLMACVFLSTKMVEDPSFWILLIRAGAEAAMVGGLADWFAVTALFRRPLGLPIPHTAVIPANKDRIGAGLGLFVERNFLDPDLVTAKLRSLAPARRVGTWLSEAEQAEKLAGRLAASVPALVESLSDREVRSFLARALDRQLGSIDLSALLGRGLDILRESDRHHDLFDQIVRAARQYLLDHQGRIFEAVEDRSRWWVPRGIDRRMAKALIGGVAELLEELLQRDHPVRRQFEASLDRLTRDLREDPARRAQVAAIQAELLSNPRTQAYLGEVWGELRAILLRDAAAGRDSLLLKALAGALQSLGKGLLADSEMQARLDRGIEDATKSWILPWRHEIGHFIAEVVKSWDGRTVADRVETAVGRDLQYIRINGTLVGGLVGIAIFLLSWYVL
ncbi:DUF445 domain-containing protein [Algihabitans albus]|uniref:DUF445 domain-containing protein n=1 Tax=Algihabitans albus TaxID=2164067 RepID=UPI001ABC4EA0|nr:DUF445 domain-containing protein [Algihabitans albus]